MVVGEEEVNRDDLLHAYQDHNVLAFLRVIREGESSQDDSAYTVMYGGSHFEGFADHPRIKNTARGITSTAAGAYQFLRATWDEIAQQYGLGDFSPVNQDLGAIGLIARRKALDLVIAGRLHEAIARCAKEWASLPGSTYGQPTQKLQNAVAVFLRYGGTLAADSPAVPTPEVKMPFAIFSALLPTLTQLLPELAQIFKPQSEVAQRNVAAATIVTKALTEATQSVNLQDAVEKMQGDPEAVKDARAAIASVWPALVDASPAVSEARKSAADPQQTPPWKNPAVWVTAAFVPLIYGAAWAVLYTDKASEDLKTMVVTAIFAGLLGSITGFFLGSSLGSQRKDALMSK